MTATSRSRLLAAAVSVLVIAALVGTALLATGSRTPAAAFAQAGHWVFNQSESAVVHVDSGTRQVDARVAVPGVGNDALFAVQDPSRGYLVGRKNITVFGKSTLTVETTLPTGRDELPVPVEAVGGPYLVYRTAGTVVRLGVPPVSIPVGGPVGRPVALDDGTLWLHRTDNGSLCALAATDTALRCDTATDPRATGDLAVVQSLPGFVDTTADATAMIQTAAIQPPVPLGIDLPVQALVGDRDTLGHLPAVVPGENRLVIADTGGVLVGRAGGPPVTVGLGPGRFSAPAAGDGVIAVIDVERHRLLTFGVDGKPLGSTDLPPGSGDSGIVRGGDGRLYVDDADGARTHLIGKDGSVSSIRTGLATNAVTAAAPELAALVPIVPVDLTTVSRAGSAGIGPVTTTGGDVLGTVSGGGAQVGNPPVDVPVLPKPGLQPPGAPTGVTAAPDTTGRLTVTWQAADRADQYQVLLDGAEVARTGGLTAAGPAIAAGTTHRVSVVASNSAGEGPSSAVVIVVGPTAAADAPGNARAVRHNNGPTTMITVTWTAPNLFGAPLVGYRVAVSGGGLPSYSVMANQLSHNDARGTCSTAALRYEVRAITRSPAGEEIVGAPAVATIAAVMDCAASIRLLTATATGPTTATVTFACSSGQGRVAAAGHAAIYTWPAAARYEVDCPLDGTTRTGQLVGLASGTTYTVNANITGAGGASVGQNSLSVTTR